LLQKSMQALHANGNSYVITSHQNIDETGSEGPKLHSITKFLLTVGSILGCIVLVTAVHIPGVAASVCPWCFGFESLEPGLFIEKSASESVRQHTEASLHRAKLAVGRYFGSLQSDPRIFVCVTDLCYLRAEQRGGHTVAISFLDWVIVVSPRAEYEVAFAHELSHTELHNRLGPLIFNVPTWFDEGLAVNVSDDPHFLAAPGSQTRCKVEPPTVMPLNGATWVSATEDTSTPYAEAGCLVSVWLERRGGARAVRQLVADIKAGVPFARAYGP
jgi:hypothetical protein